MLRGCLLSTNLGEKQSFLYFVGKCGEIVYSPFFILQAHHLESTSAFPPVPRVSYCVNLASTTALVFKEANTSNSLLSSSAGYIINDCFRIPSDKHRNRPFHLHQPTHHLCEKTHFALFSGIVFFRHQLNFPCVK